jgi:hypothetical protein
LKIISSVHYFFKLFLQNVKTPKIYILAPKHLFLPFVYPLLN